jgi:hypothetical protein
MHSEEKSISRIERFLYKNGLHTGLPELSRVCELVLTISATSSVDLSFSALKRIKSSIKNSQGHSRLSALFGISLGKHLLVGMKASYDFYSKVAEELCKRIVE